MLQCKILHISRSGCLRGFVWIPCVFIAIISLFRTFSECSYENILPAEKSVERKCRRMELVNKTEMGIHKTILEQRMQHVRDICNTHFIINNLLTEGTGDIQYCDIPNCASTFIHKILDYYTSDKIYKRDAAPQFISKDYTNSNERGSHMNSFSFMFVRDPYSRLFSVYESYFFHPSEFWDDIGADIIERVRVNATSRSTSIGNDVTFAELVQYLVTLDEQKNLTSKYLTPIDRLCNPCKIKVNFIGKLETISEDIDALVNELVSNGYIRDNNVPTEEIEAEINYRLSTGWIQDMFQMYSKYKSSVPHFKLMQRFWLSAQIRGKISKYYEIPYFEDDTEEIDEVTFTRSFLSAMYASKSNTNELKAQGKEALEQAYRSVPIEILLKLQKVLENDCRMFGYDNRPTNLFERQMNRGINTSFYDYFQGL